MLFQHPLSPLTKSQSGGAPASHRVEQPLHVEQRRVHRRLLTHGSYPAPAAAVQLVNVCINTQCYAEHNLAVQGLKARATGKVYAVVVFRAGGHARQERSENRLFTILLKNFFCAPIRGITAVVILPYCVRRFIDCLRHASLH